MSALDDKIHRVATDIVDDRFDAVQKTITKVDAQSNKTALVVQGISTKVDAMYGNGSGKAGILDEIREEQKVVKASLQTEQSKNASFRHEMRNGLEVLQMQKKQNRIDIKWVLGGIAFISWELFKTYVIKR